MKVTEAEFLSLKKRDRTPAPCLPKKPKYRAIPCIIDGIRFDSIKEGAYYCDLKIRVKCGEVRFFTMQTTFHLPGGVKHRVDFVEYWADGSTHFVEIKGLDLPMGRLKRKQVEAIYPVTIEVK